VRALAPAVPAALKPLVEGEPSLPPKPRAHDSSRDSAVARPRSRGQAARTPHMEEAKGPGFAICSGQRGEVARRSMSRAR